MRLPSEGPSQQEADLVYQWLGPPRIELWREDTTLPSGKTYTAHRLRTADNKVGVVIYAEGARGILFVESFRPAIQANVLELPRGFGEGDRSDAESPLRDAVRELREETGYAGIRPMELARYITDTSVLPTEVAVVRCHVDEQTPGITDGEVSRTVWVSHKDISSLIKQGIIHDAHTLAALHLVTVNSTVKKFP